jgi:hypothetical protein
VLKRYSYIGDGLSHVAFGALAIAAVLKVTNNMLIILPVTVAVAILLLCTGKNARVKGDAAIAMVSVGALALGYLLMNLFSTSANISGDVCTTLFGSTSILTLKAGEVYLCVVLSVVVLAIFVLFYHKIFAITFDENFAQATGVNTAFFNLLIAVVVAVIMAIALPLYFNRKSLKQSIIADIGNVFDNADTEETSFTNFDYKQFNIYGLSCQYVKLGLSDEITEDQAKTLYSNYVQLRTEKRGEESGEVEMYIYTPDTIFFVTKDGITTDVQTPVEILPAETTK